MIMEHGSARIGQIFDFGMLHLEWPTALFVLIVFFVTMFFLNYLLFKPILRTLEARQANIDKSLKGKEDLTAKIAQSEQDYQSKLSVMRNTIVQVRQRSLDEAVEESQKIINQSRDTVTAQLEKADQELANQRQAALQDAAALTEGLANLIKAKVLA